MGYLQLKFIKTSCRAMSDNRLQELYSLVLSQEDKTEKDYPKVLEIVKTEMSKRHLLIS